MVDFDCLSPLVAPFGLLSTLSVSPRQLQDWSFGAKKKNTVILSRETGSKICSRRDRLSRRLQIFPLVRELLIGRGATLNLRHRIFSDQKSTDAWVKKKYIQFGPPVFSGLLFAEVQWQPTPVPAVQLSRVISKVGSCRSQPIQRHIIVLPVLPCDFPLLTAFRFHTPLSCEQP